MRDADGAPPVWLSVVVPMYNAVGKIEFLLESLRSEGGSEAGSDGGTEGVEFLFIDDGSTDGTAARVADLLAGSGLHAQIERIPINAGVSAARNRGLALASGAYILFLDADDILTRGSFEGLKALLAPSPGEIPADAHLFEFRAFRATARGAARALTFAPTPPVETDRRLLLEQYLTGALVKRVAVPSSLFSTAFLRAHTLEFDPALAYGEDQHFMLRVLAAAHRVARHEGILLAYMQYADSATGVFSPRGLEVHAMMGALRSDPTFAPWRPQIETRMNRLLVGRLNHHLDHHGVRRSLPFLEDEIRPRVVGPMGVRLRLAFTHLGLYALLWLGYDRGRALLRRLFPRVAFGAVLLLGSVVGASPADGQIGTRVLAPPVPASVETPVRARAEASDRQLTAGDLTAALAPLIATGRGAPGIAGAADLRAALRGGPPPETPQWSALRRLAPGRTPELARELLPELSTLLGPQTTGGYETAWRAARIAMAEGVLAPTEAERSRWHRWGILWGVEAVLLDPDPRGTESRFWLLANLGRLALDSELPGLERGRISEVLYDLSTAILAVDPNQAGAHIILGRNHLEIRGQSLATRTLGRVAFGNEFITRSTFEGALSHLERGARLDPGMIYFQLEWAHGLWDRGQRDEARRIWRTIETLPPRLPIDEALKAEARRRLAVR
jgi:glycosyltransferase involved in cell wall biosynthesis